MPSGHKLSRRVKFPTAFPWKPIDELHNMKDHPNNHNGWYPFIWEAVMEGSDLFFQKSDV
jgi:hypothetical protein